MDLIVSHLQVRVPAGRPADLALLQDTRTRHMRVRTKHVRVRSATTQRQHTLQPLQTHIVAVLLLLLQSMHYLASLTPRTLTRLNCNFCKHHDSQS
jgi:hypothetical protein